LHGVADAWRGGWRHTEADRLLASAIEIAFPGTAEHTRQEREFLARAVTWAAERGIGQYIVAGTGIPAADGNVHQVAREVIPDATAVYAGADRLAVAWSRGLLADSDPGVHAVDADYIDPDAFFEALRDFADPGRPACAVLAMVLHATPPDRAREVIGGFAGRLAPGSALILSLPVGDGSAQADEFARMYEATGWTIRRHTPPVIAGWLDAAGLELVRPGIVPVQAWPSGLVPRALAHRNPGYIAAAVARVP
jgi:hypothetical protein